MADTHELHVVITRVEGALFDGKARSVYVPGEVGDMEILARHEPLITPLNGGTVRVKTDAGVERFEIAGGMLEVSHSRPTILL